MTKNRITKEYRTIKSGKRIQERNKEDGITNKKDSIEKEKIKVSCKKKNKTE